MRSALLIVLPLLAAGGLLMLLIGGDRSGSDRYARERLANERSEDATVDGPHRAPWTAEAVTSTAVIVPAGTWDADLREHEDASPHDEAHHEAMHREIRSETGEPWTLTGAKLLEILARELPEVPVRFPDKGSLAAFRKAAWPQPVPEVVRVRMLIDACPDIGFRAVSRDGALYMVPIGAGRTRTASGDGGQ